MHTVEVNDLSEGESPFGEGQGAWPRSLPEVERENDDAPEKLQKISKNISESVKKSQFSR